MQALCDVLHDGRGSGFSKVLKFPEKLVLPTRHVGPGKPQDVTTSAVILFPLKVRPLRCKECPATNRIEQERTVWCARFRYNYLECNICHSCGWVISVLFLSN